MKKSYLALFAASIFLLSGCNEKETQALTEKLQKAEQTITQLNQDLAKSQQDFTAYKAENDQKLADLEKTKNAFPALKVEIEPLFSKSQKVKPKEQTYFEEGQVNYFISIPKTGFEWLDNLVIRKLWLDYSPEDAKQDPDKVTGNEKAQLLKAFEKDFNDSLAEVRDGPVSGMEVSAELRYLGQRDNIVSFSVFNYSFSGGAHGLFATTYINIDVDKKSIITLDKLMTKANQTKAKALLWDAYLLESPVDENGKREPFTAKADFDISNQFYFTNDGIVFSYAPYELGPFADGEKTLTLPWYEVNNLIAKEYQRTKKDGFDLIPSSDLR